MPIVIKKFEWRQSEHVVIVTVPSWGIHPSKVHIFYSERYIKANYEQYFFELVLLRPINVKDSKCTITSTEIVFELMKAEAEEWPTLEPELDKNERMKLKLLLIEETHEKMQNESKEWENKKSELKRVAVNEQMKIESEIKNKIENLKIKEKEEALGDVRNWHHDLSEKTKKSLRKKKKKFEQYLATRPNEINIFQEKNEFDIPQPRRAQQLDVDFTPRIFPTPMRESKAEEENEWMRMQADARRSVGFVCEDLRPEEKNPQYLLKKGDSFMNNNNYLGAISAYTFGITLSDKFVDLYIARSRAHYAQGNYQKTARDCSTALELLIPKVEANLKERAECIGRRGMALCKLKMLSKGIGELEASLKLMKNEEFASFLQEAEKQWMNSSDSE
ncbi:dynein axonemal assembly factor 4-like [Coccinella septempunctata]|uniref:dynein axonemal assembly factor 4-like n=1 Tax=Coccinella septempunctata TaxID=41139 RepID=UPI001D06A2CA|nr:dynein axonemal assembly factor 4-like [Coccinella septempunctata]